MKPLPISWAHVKPLLISVMHSYEAHSSSSVKAIELIDTIKRRCLNIMCLQETKWVGEKTKVLYNTGYKLWYSGKIELGMRWVLLWIHY